MEHAQSASLQHRLKRRELWVSLWLTRLLAVLAHICGEPRESSLHTFVDRALSAFAKVMMCIFLCHASTRAKHRAPRSFRDPRKRDVISMRAIFGASLRHAFKAKSFAGRLRKIQRALDRRDTLMARLAKRLRRGMSKHSSAHTRAPIGADEMLALIVNCVSIRAADTS